LSLEHCRRVTFVPDGLLVLTGLAGVASLNLQARRDQGSVSVSLGQPESFPGPWVELLVLIRFGTKPRT